MSKHIGQKQLSAFMDGWANDPVGVKRHLDACADCRARLEGLEALSRGLKAMPAPSVRPEFVTRVMAQAQDVLQQARVPSFVRAGLSLAVLTGLVLVVFGVFHPMSFTPSQPTDYDATQAALADAEWDIEGDAFVDETVPTSDEVIFELSQEEWFASLEQEWDRETDLQTVVDSLTAEETLIFEELLRTYREEGFAL